METGNNMILNGKKRRRTGRQRKRRRKPKSKNKASAELIQFEIQAAEEHEKHLDEEEKEEMEEQEQSKRKHALFVAFVSNIPYNSTINNLLKTIRQTLISNGKNELSCSDAQYNKNKRKKNGKNGSAFVAFIDEESRNFIMNQTIVIERRRLKFKIAGKIPREISLSAVPRDSDDSATMTCEVQEFKLTVGHKSLIFHTYSCTFSVSDTNVSVSWHTNTNININSSTWKINSLAPTKIFKFKIDFYTCALVFYTKLPPVLETNDLLFNQNRSIDPTKNNAFGRSRSVHLIVNINKCEQMIDFLRRRNLISDSQTPYSNPIPNFTPAEELFQVLEENFPLSVRKAIRCFCEKIDPLALPLDFKEIISSTEPSLIEKVLYYLASFNIHHFNKKIWKYYVEYLDEDEDDVMKMTTWAI